MAVEGEADVQEFGMDLKQYNENVWDRHRTTQEFRSLKRMLDTFENMP